MLVCVYALIAGIWDSSRDQSNTLRHSTTQSNCFMFCSPALLFDPSAPLSPVEDRWIVDTWILPDADWETRLETIKSAPEMLNMKGLVGLSKCATRHQGLLGTTLHCAQIGTGIMYKTPCVASCPAMESRYSETLSKKREMLIVSAPISNGLFWHPGRCHDFTRTSGSFLYILL